MQILVIGGGREGEMAVLSRDKSKWLQFNQPRFSSLSGGGVVYLNGEIYSIGGYSSSKRLQKLDKKLKWIELAGMNRGRLGIENSCLVWNGAIWVLGGYDWETEEYLNSVERYYPEEDKWTEMPLVYPFFCIFRPFFCK